MSYYRLGDTAAGVRPVTIDAAGTPVTRESVLVPNCTPGATATWEGVKYTCKAPVAGSRQTAPTWVAQTTTVPGSVVQPKKWTPAPYPVPASAMRALHFVQWAKSMQELFSLGIITSPTVGHRNVAVIGSVFLPLAARDLGNTVFAGALRTAHRWSGEQPTDAEFRQMAAGAWLIVEKAKALKKCGLKFDPASLGLAASDGVAATIGDAGAVVDRMLDRIATYGCSGAQTVIAAQQVNLQKAIEVAKTKEQVAPTKGGAVGFLVGAIGTAGALFLLT
jgi:hypothetical protein